MTVIRFDTVFPDGSPRGTRSVLVSLVDGGAGGSNSGLMVADTVAVQLDAAGLGSANLPPNTSITPTGTYYRCTLKGSQPSVVRFISITGSTPVNTNWDAPSIQVLSPVPPAYVPGSGGVSVHTDLTGRSAVDQHPTSAITGLDTALAALQPLDSDLTAIAALATTSYGRAFLTLADAAAGRTALGLGTAATTAAAAYEVAGAAAAAQAASQPLDSDLTAIAALTTTAFGRGLLALADAAAGRTALGLGTAATSASTAFEVAGAAAAAQAASQPLDADLTAVAAVATTSYGRSYLALADAAAARTLVGLGSVDNTADTAKPVSAAQQTALDLKANLASPTFTGTPTAPTAAVGTDSTQVATTEFVTDYRTNSELGMDAGPLAFARWRSNGVRSFAGGVTTSGSPTITSTTANFTSADIGKTVTAPGVTANVVLVTPGTTITAVASATSATMSANAAATTTGTNFMLGARPLRHIVCFGDSVTQGYGIASKRQSWVDDLRTAIGRSGETVHGGWQPVVWAGLGRWATTSGGGWTSDGASASNLSPSGLAGASLRRPSTTLGSLTWYRPGNMPVSEVTIWWVDDTSSGASFSWKCNATVNTGTDYNTVTCSAPATPTLKQTVINLSSHPGTFVENFSTIRIRNAAGNLATALASPMILGISVRSSPTRTVTDGVTTNASASITSATAAFTQADVGKLIGTTNVTVGSYILSVQSATAATLSANATATSSAQTFNLLSPITGIEVNNFGVEGESLSTVVPKSGDWGAMFDAIRPELAIIGFSSDCASPALVAAFPARMDTVASRLAPYADLIAFGEPEQDTLSGVRPTADQDTVRNYSITRCVGGWRTVADGVTNTTTTITSATAAFVAADVGSTIGGPGIPPATYITVIDSATSVTVSNTCTASATALTLRIGRSGGGINFKTRWGSKDNAVGTGYMENVTQPLHPNAEGDREIAATFHRFLRTQA